MVANRSLNVAFNVALGSLLLVGLLVGLARAAGGLEARLAHDVVREGEEVQLVLRAELDGDLAPPDLTQLEKDFEVLGTSQSQQISIVGGLRTASLDWIVTLVPRRTGEIVVPAIAAGSAMSEPLRLRVEATSGDVAWPATSDPPETVAALGSASRRPSNVPASRPDLFIESSADQSSPFVQGEVRYTVRVYDGVGLLEGGLSEPQVEGARISPVGEDRTFEEVVKGRRYRVFERQYAVFPQTSGELVIPPVTLEARVEDAQARPRSRLGNSMLDEMFDDPFFAGFPFGGSLFDRMMNRGREVRVRSNPVHLSVQARPDGAESGWFLPARRVEFAESFAPAEESFRVGDAIERTVTLRALGASAEQLPRFTIPAPDGVQQYDEGSRDQTVPTDDGVVSVLEQTVALVPTRSGSLTLPAVEVKWFDVESKTQRTARLPAKTIEILPAAGEPAAAQRPPVAARTKTEKIGQAKVEPADSVPAKAVPPLATESAPSQSQPTPAGTARLPAWWPAALAALAFALGLGGSWLYRRRRSSAGGTSGAQLTARTRDLTQEIRAACEAGDARAARNALVAWARATWGNDALSSCTAIARRLAHPGLAEAAAALERSLYAPDGAAFDGADLWQQFRSALRRGSPAERSDTAPILPGLYPETT